MTTEDNIEKYAEAFSTEESPILQKLNRETHLKVLYPRMLSGKLQGNLLKMISCMLHPSSILEIGTFTGYSAICLAEGLADKGMLHTIEVNPELEEMINRYFNEAGITAKTKLHIGHALDIIPTLNSMFDMVFIDADKENYLNYYHLVFDKVRKGGFILADNVLWGGKVIKKTASPDKETKGIKEFNEFVQQDKRVENTLLPLRDGLMIIRKL
jgi:predicted O-methyltransferase YrrM